MASKERYELVYGFRVNRPLGRGGLDLYGLGTVEDSTSDQSTWLGLKPFIQEILDLGPQISAVQQKLGRVVYTLKQRLDKGEIDQATYERIVTSLQPDIDKVNSDLATWWKVEQGIKKWMPTWIGTLEGTQLSGLGFLFLLPVAAAVALGFVAVEGMRLLSEYRQHEDIIQKVAVGKLAPEAGKILLEASSAVSGGFGGAVSSLMLPIGLAIGGLLLLKFWPARV